MTASNHISKFLFVLLLMVSSSTNAWEITRNFNQGVNGLTVNKQDDGFDDAATQSYYSTDKFFEGGMAAELNIAEGDQGWSRWGGVINFPSRIYDKGYLWFQMYIYIPADFQLVTNQGSLKTIRFASNNSDGSGNGFFDIQMADQGKDKAFRLIREYDNENGWAYFGDPAKFERDRWHRITVFQRTDYKTVDEGGVGVTKIWLNGQLITENTTNKVLVNDGSYYTALYLFTYWNGDSPTTHKLWVDDIRISSEAQPDWAYDIINQLAAPAAPSLEVDR